MLQTAIPGYLACSENLPTGLLFFFKLSKAISGSTEPIFTISSPNGGICVNVVNLVQFYRFLKGHCHGNQFCSKSTYFLQLLLSHSEMEWDIATLMCALTA